MAPADGDVTGALAWNPLSPILLTGAVAVVAVLVVLLEIRQQANAAMLMRAGC